MSNIQVTRDATLNDSDKSFTVPGNQAWRVLFAHVDLTTTATAGNRQLQMIVTDADGNKVIDAHAGATQAASLTREYNFKPGIYRETAFVDADIEIPIPVNLVLLPGWTIRFLDNTATDAAADDMTVSFTYDLSTPSRLNLS